MNELDTPSYRNPIINADWPDPDAIRVGDTYIMVTSSFSRTPGLPVLESTNLVDWEIVGHALTNLTPDDHFRLPRPGGGVWAPSIRHHDGIFYIVYPDPDHGVYVLTATDYRGPWSAPHLLFAARGVIDPCPLWDDDGRAYLIHAWAPSRSGIGDRLDLLEVGADLREVRSTRRTVIDATDIDGCHTLEGPKLYRERGWYWIFAPAGGVATGWQSVFRARTLDGPWEHRIALAQGDTAVNGPHQGAWVTTAGGEDWFLHFQDRGPFGRVLHLQPMRWTEDGWPIIGAVTPGYTFGLPVLGDRTPDGLPRTNTSPATSDRFDSTSLGLQWTFPANPPADCLTLDGDGCLRLMFVPNDHGDLRALPQLLTQPLHGRASMTRTRLTLPPGISSARAGLAILGQDTAWVGMERRPGGALWLVIRRTDVRGAEADLAEPIEAIGDSAELTVLVDDGGLATFSWSSNAGGPGSAGQFRVSPGRWVGAELALFAAAPFGSGRTEECAVFENFEVAVAHESAAAMASTLGNPRLPVCY